MKNIFLIILTGLILSGCASYGKEIKQSDMNQIQQGKTTKEEIIKVFGQPDSVYYDKDRRLTFSYFAGKVKNTAWNFIPIVNIFHSEMKMKNQMLIICFSKDNIVDEYSFTSPDKTINSGILP